MNLFSRLKAFFLPKKILLSGDEVAAGQGGGWRREFVVARADCQYRQQDFSSLPARGRKAAARLAARRLEPSPGVPVHIAWLGSVAHFWFHVPADGQTPSMALSRWVPESLLIARDEQCPVRLLQLSSGYEGQVWKSGQLVASQWWGELPTLESWHRFLRGAGTLEQLPSQVPSPVVMAWSDRPWGERQRMGMVGADLYEQLAWSGFVLVAGLLVGWHLAGLLRTQWAFDRMQQQLEAARAEAAPVLALREQAEADLAQMNTLRQLHAGLDDRTMMAAVIKALPEGASFASWNRDAGSLRVLVRHAETDPRVFVSAFADSPVFSSVSVSPQAEGVMQLIFPLEATPEVPADGQGAL